MSIIKIKVDDKPRRQFEIGDVLAWNVRGNPKWYKGLIIQKLGVKVYEFSVPELNVIWKRDWNQLSYRPAESSEQEHVFNENPVLTVTHRSNRDRIPPVRYVFDDVVNL